MVWSHLQIRAAGGRHVLLNVQRRDTGYVCHVKPLWDVERVAL